SCCSPVTGDEGGDPVAPFRANAPGEQHERRIPLTLENLVGSLGKDDRCEWPEGLPVLHPHVDLVFHFGPARISEDAPISESARSEFRAALEQAEDCPFGQQARRAAADIGTGRSRGLGANQALAYGGPDFS